MTAIVLEVGCLECGEETSVLGPVHPDVDTAKASVPEDAREEWRAPSPNTWGGQMMYVVVDLSVPCVAAVAQWDPWNRTAEERR